MGAKCTTSKRERLKGDLLPSGVCNKLDHYIRQVVMDPEGKTSEQVPQTLKVARWRAVTLQSATLNHTRSPPDLQSYRQHTALDRYLREAMKPTPRRRWTPAIHASRSATLSRAIGDFRPGKARPGQARPFSAMPRHARAHTHTHRC